MSQPKRMKKGGARLTGWLAGWIARSALRWGRVLPSSFAWWFGGLLGWTFGGLHWRDQNDARTHLRRAWPDRDAAWIERITRNNFRHHGRMALWSLANFHHPPQAIQRGIVVEGADNLRAAIRASRRSEGTVIFSGHFGNWELLGRAHAAMAPLAMIGKRMRNPDLDALLIQLRLAMPNAQIIYQDQGVMPALRALREGRLLSALADQDVKRLTMAHVPWFGIPAATPIGPAQLARISGCALQPVFCYRKGGRWVVHWGPRRLCARTADREADATALMAWVTAYFEQLVRRHPEQWVWWHRRWRTPPVA